MSSNTECVARRNTGNNTPYTSDNTDCVRITEPIHDEYLAGVANRGRAEPLARLLGRVVDADISGHLSKGQLAARSWLAANGDTERRHTCGVYLRDARMRGADPVLCVYVDSSARLTDFRANKDVYLARLANAGLSVSDVEFRLSRKRGPLYAASHGEGSGEGRRESAPPALPPLTHEDRERVGELVADLPDGLKESVSRAISLSMRREKCEHTQKDKKPA